MVKFKSFFLFLIITISPFALNAQSKAKEIADKAAQEASVTESINYIESELKKLTNPSDKRSTYILLASLQEQLSQYPAAQKNYASAAGISAGTAEGMPKKSNEQLVLDAVRCALCCGEFSTADSYLNSAVRNSKNPQIQSYIKLYTQWSNLCKAEKEEDLQEPIEILKAYLKIENMKEIHPVILLTLWYITGDSTYSDDIRKKFPNSTEASIVKGDVNLLPTPFWFFVPKSGIAEIGTGTYTNKENNQTASESQKADNSTGDKVSENAITKLQLGLFRTESNAKLLKEELIKKGFEAYITSEKRASGTTYYIVLVDEDKDNSIAEKLRSSGYECYAVE